MTEHPDHVDPAARVRQLLLSGDNLIKNRDSPERYDRARDRYVTARAIADAAHLAPSLLAIIDLRLTELADPAEGAP